MARVKQSVRKDWISIRDIVGVASVPVRCVAVASTDHLFLAGESGHVTHNTHWWTESNGGMQLDQVCRRNLGKSRDGSGRMLETTNAHAPGVGSVAEKSYQAWLAGTDGRSRRSTVLYDAREAPADIDMAVEAPAYGRPRGSLRRLDMG